MQHKYTKLITDNDIDNDEIEELLEDNTRHDDTYSRNDDDIESESENWVKTNTVLFLRFSVNYF